MSEKSFFFVVVTFSGNDDDNDVDGTDIDREIIGRKTHGSQIGKNRVNHDLI